LIGAIRGTRLDPEVKLELVGAIVEAKRQNFPIGRSCELLMLSRRRLHRWIAGKDFESLTVGSGRSSSRRRAMTG
jgi:hypothetical protein